LFKSTLRRIFHATVSFKHSTKTNGLQFGGYACINLLGINTNNGVSDVVKFIKNEVQSKNLGQVTYKDQKILIGWRNNKNQKFVQFFDNRPNEKLSSEVEGLVRKVYDNFKDNLTLNNNIRFDQNYGEYRLGRSKDYYIAQDISGNKPIFNAFKVQTGQYNNEVSNKFNRDDNSYSTFMGLNRPL